MADPLSPAQRAELMGKVRSVNTGPELRLRKALQRSNARGYRLHPRKVTGRPDIAWIGLKLALFVDGAFWHGHPDYYHGQSGEFWDRKIARNKERDREVNTSLVGDGWTVLRYWDFEIAQDADACAREVARTLRQLRNKSAHRGTSVRWRP